jgi:hypoxanthine phosphoribosyltransferase
MKRIITNNEFNGLVANICRKIAASGWRPDYIVGITRGGLTPAVMISHYLDVPMHTLNVSLRDSDSDIGPESNLWMAEDAFGYNASPKNILIVDDINDSGATINWIMEDWASGCFPDGDRWKEMWGDNVRFAVVFDNLASKANVKMDYVGEEINKAEQDVWIDFPYESWWAR